ncbi:MAG: hypothetical protein LBS56_10350 [Propionibacteriaceae bacterium]|jgi:hypothetical protein|nr:hypothetical protein [Propionibacteriaceae bacterium]
MYNTSFGGPALRFDAARTALTAIGAHCEAYDAFLDEYDRLYALQPNVDNAHAIILHSYLDPHGDPAERTVLAASIVAQPELFRVWNGACEGLAQRGLNLMQDPAIAAELIESARPTVEAWMADLTAWALIGAPDAGLLIRSGRKKDAEVAARAQGNAPRLAQAAVARNHLLGPAVEDTAGLWLEHVRAGKIVARYSDGTPKWSGMAPGETDWTDLESVVNAIQKGGKPRWHTWEELQAALGVPEERAQQRAERLAAREAAELAERSRLNEEHREAAERGRAAYDRAKADELAATIAKAIAAAARSTGEPSATGEPTATMPESATTEEPPYGDGEALAQTASTDA